MKRIVKLLILGLFLMVLSSCDLGDSKTKYTVNFDTNGGLPVMINQQIIAKGSLVRRPIDPTHEQDVFLYWYNEEFDRKWDFDLDRVYQDLTLIAKYEPRHFKLFIPSSIQTNITDVDHIAYKTKVILNVIIPSGLMIDEFKVNQQIINDDYYEFYIEKDTYVTIVFKSIATLEKIYTEDFSVLQDWKITNGYNSSAYLDYTYTGAYGFYYELVNARVDLGMKDGDQGITIKGKGNDEYEEGAGWLLLNDIAEGLSRLEFTARLPFSPNSKYPQGPGKDTSQNVKIKVFINEQLFQIVQFENNKKADSGQTFVFENLNYTGLTSFRIEVSSGHALTIGSISWTSNNNGVIDHVKMVVDFEGTKFVYDTTETSRLFNGRAFILKEIYTDQMDPLKEQQYMTEENGRVVGRFRGKNTAYIYNQDVFDYVSKISFDAKQFGNNDYFAPDAVIKIYYQTVANSEFILLEEITNLPTLNFKNFVINIDKEDVIIKIEVTGGTLNIDNIIYEG